MEIELRVVLLGVGLIILLVVAFDFFRRKSGKEDYVRDEPKYAEPNYNEPKFSEPKYSEPRAGSIPMIDDYSEPMLDIYQTQAESLLPTDDIEYEQAYDNEPAILNQSMVASLPQNIISISIMSREPYGFPGSDLLAAFEGAKLTFGRNEIFHCIEEDEIIFSLVNAVEPGYFILETMPNEHIPGVTLILIPEDVSNPPQAFDKLIRIAKQISFAVNGELVDHARQPLTLATIEQYRKQTDLVPS